MDNLHVRLNIDLGKDHPSSEEHLKYGKIAKFSWKCYKRRNLFIYLFTYSFSFAARAGTHNYCGLELPNPPCLLSFGRKPECPKETHDFR